LNARAPELLPNGRPSNAWAGPALQAQPGNEAFDDGREYVFRWEGHHDPAQVRTLFSTFSSWIALPAERREPLLDDLETLARDDFGGVVVRPYRTSLRVRRRRPR